MGVGIDAAGDNVHARGVNHPGIGSGSKAHADLADALTLLRSGRTPPSTRFIFPLTSQTYLGYSNNVCIEASAVSRQYASAGGAWVHHKAGGQSAPMALQLNVPLMKKYTKLRTY